MSFNKSTRCHSKNFLRSLGNKEISFMINRRYRNKTVSWKPFLLLNLLFISKFIDPERYFYYKTFSFLSNPRKYLRLHSRFVTKEILRSCVGPQKKITNPKQSDHKCLLSCWQIFDHISLSLKSLQTNLLKTFLPLTMKNDRSWRN